MKAALLVLRQLFDASSDKGQIHEKEHVGTNGKELSNEKEKNAVIFQCKKSNYR